MIHGIEWGQTGLVDTKVEDSPIEEVDRFNPDIEGRSQYIVRRDGLTGFFHPGAHKEENILPGKKSLFIQEFIEDMVFRL